MRYESTRGGLTNISSAEAIKMGIAPDGGLFVPDKKVSIDLSFIEGLVKDTYQQRAQKILSLFLTDFDKVELHDCINDHGSQFSAKEIAPLKQLLISPYYGHGMDPCAFKDMALQILPHFMVKAIENRRESRNCYIGW